MLIEDLLLIVATTLYKNILSPIVIYFFPTLALFSVGHVVRTTPLFKDLEAAFSHDVLHVQLLLEHSQLQFKSMIRVEEMYLNKSNYPHLSLLGFKLFRQMNIALVLLPFSLELLDHLRAL